MLALLSIALIPILYIPHFGSGFAEPKLVGLFLLAIGFAASLFIKRKIIPRSPEETIWLWFVGALLVLKLCSFSGVVNAGLAIQSFGTVAAFFLIVLGLAHARISPQQISLVMCMPIIATLIAALAMIFFRTALVSDYSPFGASIGLKNSVSVFLIQLVPFLLILCVTSKSKLVRFGAIFLLMLVVYVAIAYRTRSAWWMIVAYLFGLGILSYYHSAPYRRLFISFFAAVLVAVCLVGTVPNSLRWNDSSPYLKSLSTLVSFEQSSGRNTLWRVALSMIAEHPLQGVGLGQYPALWPGYIAKAAEEPSQFAMLRPDLPLFNDYLQQTVEAGIPTGILFGLIVLGVPWLLFVRQLRADREHIPTSSLLLLGCLALAVDACFDAPFSRAENVLAYGVMLGLVFQRQQYATADRRAPLPRSLALPLLWSLTGLLIIATIMLTIGLGSRVAWAKTHRLELLTLSMKFWPWDREFGRDQVMEFVAKGEVPQAEIFAEFRRRIWPHDPESYWIQADLLAQQNRFSEARNIFRRAVRVVEDGRCFMPGYQSYRKMIQRAELSADLAPLEQAIVVPCLTELASAARQEAPTCEMPEIVSGRAVFSERCQMALVSSNRFGPVRPLLVKFPTTGEPTVEALELPADAGDLFARDLSPSCDEVALVGDRAGNEQYAVSRYDLKTKTLSRSSSAQYVDAGNPLYRPNSAELAFSAGRSIIRVELLSGVERPVLSASGNILSFVWSTDGTMLYLQEEGGKISSVDPASGKQHELWRAPRTLYSPAQLRAASDGIFFVSDHESDFSQLYHLNTNTKTVERVAAENFDQTDPIEHENQIWYRAVNGTRVCVTKSSSRSGVSCEGVTYATAPSLPLQPLLYADLNHPLSLYRRDSSGLEDLLGVSPTRVRVAVDEIPSSAPSLSHLLFHAAAARAENSVVVWLHGGPYESVSPRYNPFIANLVAAGHAVFALNYPGSTGAGNRYEQRGLAGDALLDVQLQSIEATLQKFRQSYPQYQRVHLLGVSYGAALAHRLRARSPQQFASLIDFSGKTDLTLEQVQSGAFDLQQPALFIWGQNDQFLSAPGRQVFLERQRSNPNSQMLVLPNEGHVLRSANANQTSCNKILAFLQ